MVRAPCFDNNGMKKGAWSEEEDNKLRAYIQTYGHRNWRQLPKLAGLSRCGKSCRLRWMNYLRPNMKRGNFTKEEDDVIVSLHNKLGNKYHFYPYNNKKWSLMAAQLPGRSDNEIKNRWHAYLKNRVRKTQTVLKKEQVGSLKANPASATRLNLKHQEEVSILLTVLSSDQSPSSTSTSEPSPSWLSGSGQAEAVMSSNVTLTPPFSDPSESFWTQPFLTDNDSIISSCDTILSPIFF